MSAVRDVMSIRTALPDWRDTGGLHRSGDYLAEYRAETAGYVSTSHDAGRPLIVNQLAR